MSRLSLEHPVAEGEVRTRAGAKGRNLERLTEAGVDVPRWAVVGTDVLARFRAETGLDRAIREVLDRLVPADPDRAAAEIEGAFTAAEPGEEAVAAIERAYAAAGSGAVAVRSSGTDEDGPGLSFAGQYATFLDVTGVDAVVGAVRACWASAYSARALSYRTLHDLPVDGIEMAVLVQAMVPAEKSGVLFTANPATGSADELVIGSAYGLGEGLVSGQVDADSIVVDRATGHVKETVVGDKAEQVVGAGGGVETRPVPDAARRALSLDDDEIAVLCDCGARVESVFGAPQDVEWAIADGRLWILQSRPITTPVSTSRGELRVWDNSNIIESYGEVTAPLTFTFARRAYHSVYNDYCRLLGVPRRDREAMEAWLPNMLGYFNGRVYYNLLNWYRVIGLLPFYSVNRRILELSMGVSEPLDAELAESLRPLRRDSAVARAAARGPVALRFAWYFLTIESSVRRFTRDFYRVYEEFDPVDYSGLPADEVYAAYTDAERRLLSRWGRMILLEAVLGMSFGGLHTLTERWLPDAPEWFMWEMAKVESGVESSQPAERIADLARMVRGSDHLSAVFEALPPGRERDALDERARDDPEAAALADEIRRYVHDFGYRNVNELKLEEPDLREDPSMLFEMIRSALAQPDPGEGRAAPAGEDGDAYLRAHLRGPRRWAYLLVRRKVRRALRAREEVRFCRTRAFGMSRRMFRAIGEDLTRAGALESSRDVFHLRLEELRGCFDGTIGHRELPGIVQQRRRLQGEYEEMHAPPRFVTRGTPYWSGFEREWRSSAGAGDDGAGELRGVPCSAGVFEGEASVVERPCDVGGRVLVAYRTDPGWIAALRSASALVIERGSPLTHVAVVARELGIPTVIQVPGVTQRIRTGMRVRVDGGAGTVTLCDEGEDG